MVPKSLLRGLEESEISGGIEHPNYSITKISQNTEKSPGYLRKLAVTLTPVKDHQLILLWKTHKEYNDNIKTIIWVYKSNKHYW